MVGYGIRPLGGQDLKVMQFSVDSSNSTAIYKDGPVIKTSSGTANGQGSASDAYIGPVQGIYDSNKVELDYLPISTAGYVDVATNKDMLVLIKAAGAVSLTDIFNTADLDSFAGSTTTGQSTAALSATTSSGCAQFRILGKLETPGNAWDDSDVELICVAYEHGLGTPATEGL